MLSCWVLGFWFVKNGELKWPEAAAILYGYPLSSKSPGFQNQAITSYQKLVPLKRNTKTKQNKTKVCANLLLRLNNVFSQCLPKKALTAKHVCKYITHTFENNILSTHLLPTRERSFFFNVKGSSFSLSSATRSPLRVYRGGPGACMGPKGRQEQKQV